jgi:membrane protein
LSDEPSAPPDAAAAAAGGPGARDHPFARAARRAHMELGLVGRAAWRGFVAFYYSDDLTHAASVAYFGLLSLFPAFLLAFAVLGVFTANDANRAAVVEFFLRYFPTRLEFFTRQLDALSQTPLRFGVGGGIALVWAALGVFGAITAAVNYAWKVEKQRSYLRHQLLSFLMMAAAGLVLLAALLLVSAIQIVHASWFARVVAGIPRLASLGGVAVSYLTTLMLIVVVGLVYAFAPNTRVRWRDVWVGAIFTGLLERGVLETFSYYVRDLSRLSAIHGSIAAVVVFLIWVYTSAVVLLYGAEFTAAYSRLRREIVHGGS